MAQQGNVSERLVDKELLLRRRIPSTAWWKGLVTGDGSQAVFAAPYTVQLLDEQFVVCNQPPPSQLTTEGVKGDWRFELPRGSQRVLTDYDLVSVTFKYSNDGRSVATVPLVRTSVFMTVVYHEPTELVLSSEHRIVQLNSYGAGIVVAGLGNSSKWLICCDAGTELHQRDAHTLGSTISGGAVRISLLVNGGRADEIAALVQARYTVPMGGTVQVSATQKVGSFTILWKTAKGSMVVEGGEEENSNIEREAPLLAVFPRNYPARDDYREIRQPLHSATWIEAVGPYHTGQKGRMYVVLGSRWVFAESLESIRDLPRRGPLGLEHKARILDVVGAYAIADPELLVVT
ncbi:hypothetical protein GGI22_002589, partial [Coemansia erecta]